MTITPETLSIIIWCLACAAWYWAGIQWGRGHPKP